ncbi:uncharacterized protein LOC102720304 [Oryza brachyantha]|uniref:uncharacterized protein LOC102720304 n=1 Tax=Oryza brachyantha TaxID=4533 RepID=UPI001ADD4DEC|nr:uncharacterized protein LOC102720304 [Oryza brachyantha]
MACINMYNPDGGAAFGGGQPPALGPRISFSSDFVVEPPPVQNRAMNLRCQEEDVNFEFSVGSHPMMAADQLFSKGRILPLKEGGFTAGRPPTTLRDELRGGGGGDDRASGKGSSRWKEMLGLRKPLCVGGVHGAAKKSTAVVDAEMATDVSESKQEL